MIFGHTIDFSDEPALNYRVGTFEKSTMICVRELSLPDFNILTDYMPHSLQNVRYGGHRPFTETKGKNVEWMMEIENVLRLVWFPDTSIIGYEKGKGFTPERLRFWVYHTFLPLLFQMEGLYNMLHVGCVEVNAKAVILMAPSFGGKSTLTDFFLQKGHRLLSDDTLAIEKKGESYRAVASWPFHRPYREPEVLGKKTENFVTEPLEIAAVYRLEKTAEDAPVQIEEIRGIDKFKTLHMGTFIPLSFLKDEAFEFHTSFAKTVPVYRIGIPWNRNRLPEVYEAIVKHTENGSVGT